MSGPSVETLLASMLSSSLHHLEGTEWDWTLFAAIAGPVFALVGVRLGWAGVAARRQSALVAATTTTPCGMVAASRNPPRRALTECCGRAGPGPRGLLTAPLSSRKCVWYRSLVVRERPSRETGTIRKVESENTSDAPFTLDDGSGSVLVDPRRADVDAPRQVHEHTESGRLGRTRHYHEWIIAAGDEIYVLGAAALRDAGPTLASPRGRGRLLISTRREEELASSSRRDSRTLVWLAAAFVVGGTALAAWAVAAWGLWP